MSPSITGILSFRKFAGQRRLLLLCLMLFFFSAALSFWWFFPADIVQRRLVQEISRKSGLQMRGYNASMLFPLGLKFSLFVYSDSTELADARLESLQVTPVWRALLSDDPAAHIEGKIEKGAFSLNASQSGELDLVFSDIDLLPLQKRDNDYRVAGFMTGQFNAEQFTANMEGRGEFTVQIEQSVLLGLEAVGLPGRFEVGTLQVAGKFNQRRVSLERIISSEGFLELSGGGTLLIGDTSEQTRLNLNVRIRPNQTTPDSLRDLIQLTGVRPTADGSYLLRIGGTLEKPVVR